MDTALDLLSQFTGTGGGAKHALVNFGVAAIFWALLLVMARLAPDRERDRTATVLTIGFAIALSREVLMLGVKIIEAYGLLTPEQLHLVFPPLEHALSNVGLALVAGMFAARLTGDVGRWMQFTKYAVATLVTVYVSTASWWAQFSWRNPEIRFGQTWTDWAFRIAMSTILAVVIVALLRGPRSRSKSLVTLAFLMFFTNEFLKIIDMALAEQYESTFATVRHAMFLAALPMLAYVYIKDQASHLRDLLFSLEDRVAERTGELADAVSLLESSNSSLLELSTTDALTALGNRLGLDERLATLWNEAQRTTTPISVLILDLDNFKAVNDDLGHTRGDAALRHVAACVRAHARKNDFAARYGGDEFVLLLADTDEVEAKAIAERIRAEAASDLPRDGSRPVTLSIGVATARPGPGPGEDVDAFIEFADAALYRAKESGRNRVVTHEYQAV